MNSKYDIIYEIQIIIIFLSSLLTLVVQSWQVFFYHHNIFISPSPLLIVICCCFPFFPLRRWVWPLVGITDYIGNNYLSDHNITIYNYLIRALYRLNDAVSHSLAIYSSAMAPYHRRYISVLFFVIFNFFIPVDECDHSLGSLIKL